MQSRRILDLQNIYKVKIEVKRFNQPVKMEVVSAKPKVGTFSAQVPRRSVVIISNYRLFLTQKPLMYARG